MAGLAAALVLTRLMETLLFAVRPNDPVTLVGVAALIAALAGGSRKNRRNERTGQQRAPSKGLIGGRMSLLHKLLGRSQDPKTRTRVCVECGMPLDQHKPWCAIWQAQQEMAQKGPALRTG